MQSLSPKEIELIKKAAALIGENNISSPLIKENSCLCFFACKENIKVELANGSFIAIAFWVKCKHTYTPACTITQKNQLEVFIFNENEIEPEAATLIDKIIHN